MEDQKFYIGLKAFIEHEGKLLVLRSNIHGEYSSSLWGLPGGKITEEETSMSFEATLRREIQEELGLKIRIQVGSPFTAWKYIRPNKTPILLVGISCVLEGGNIELSNEFDKAEWVTEEEALRCSFLPGHPEAIQKWFSLKTQEALR